SNLDRPHGDALIVTLNIAGYEVPKLMIDTGSSVDLIFYNTLKGMEIDDYEIIGQKTKKELIDFLKSNVKTFAWSTNDMKGIDPNVTTHKLKVDPTFKPIKQKRRKLGLEKAQAVNDEVDRLTKAGSIREVHYPDCFPLPQIDRLVEATAGHRLLSFMDAFSGYNQIMMDPVDQEKTAFITERGTYCYKVMPFGLKNAGATYQRLVNKMFAGQLGKTMEVYIDDMLVKSSAGEDHISHLRKCFDILNKYDMKLNPTKCTFGVPSGEFLGFISKSTDKCLPFYKLLRNNKKFVWDEKCEEAFKQLKAYLSEPPILSKPVVGEPLYLYLAVSTAAVSGVLVREEQNEQRPVYYTSKSLIDAETRYPAMEKLALAVVTAARKLRPYFQSHSIVVMTSQPLRMILHSPSQSGRLAKWAIELSEYDIEYRPRAAAKAQVLADFIIELTSEHQFHGEYETRDERMGAYLEVVQNLTRQFDKFELTRIPRGENSSADALAALASTSDPLVKRIIPVEGIEKPSIDIATKAEKESKLKAQPEGTCPEAVATQVFTTFWFPKTRICSAKKHTSGNIIQVTEDIPRNSDSLEPDLENTPGGTNSDPVICRVKTRSRTALQNSSGGIPRNSDSLESNPTNTSGGTTTPGPEQEPPSSLHNKVVGREDWRIPITQYILEGKTPPNKWEARKLKALSARYCVTESVLLKRSISGPYLKCVHGLVAMRLMKEMHDGSCGNHSGGRALAIRIKRQGYFWPTIIADCEAYSSSCDKCQRHAPIIHQPAEKLSNISAPYPFMRWSMDIVGPLVPSGSGKKKLRFLLVLTDYFTKWIEAEAFQQVTRVEVEQFVWKDIVCRHGVPYEIVTDNGGQFISHDFKIFCDKWNIRLTFSSPRRPQGNVEAVVPAETIAGSLRREFCTSNPAANDQLLTDSLDLIEERRDRALIRIQNYQQAMARQYNSKVRLRQFAVGDLVLRKVFEGTKEPNAGKLGTNWEGPYQIIHVVRPGVYKLRKVRTGVPEIRSWNATNLKRYYH
ncbi:uncharacterized protein LOC130499575, partial [Raphanus sativus]|uniref:Uncharacterized protein LOC130499575 n=1 Tax=Raphanus sativus TaxID=3726 RepID=A0A9W3CE79_RAPSA